MKAQRNLKTVRPAATAALILGRPAPALPAIQKESAQTAGPARSLPPADPDPAAEFRREMTRRSEAPCSLFWHRGD